MAGRQTYTLPSESEATIRRLKNDLFLTREALISLMPVEVQEILNSHYRCADKNESLHWPGLAAGKIVDLCKPLPRQMFDGYPVGSARANCPLCGHGAESFYGQEGFAIPDGLFRHLLGTHNSRQCAVFGAAHEMARETRRNREEHGYP